MTTRPRLTLPETQKIKPLISLIETDWRVLNGDPPFSLPCLLTTADLKSFVLSNL